MDSPRGGFRALADSWRRHGYGAFDLPGSDEDVDFLVPPPTEPEVQSPPPAIGQDERRMQVRAYNLWAELLADRNFPDIRHLDATGDHDFGEYALMLDFSAGIDDPVVVHLGARLADECGVGRIGFAGQLSDVPAGSLISRITDHYIQILARQSPIGFEAEFVNRAGRLIVYRGILLPFSSDDRTIDHIYGVLNWKEVVDPQLGHKLAADLTSVLAPGSEEAELRTDPLPAPLSRRLRAMSPNGFDEVAPDGPEFTLLMARRMTSGNVVLLGEVPFDPALMKRAADKLEDR
ncbi:hypothetical protein EKN06_06755 [Croceicoccus ponticola]|uniref:PAS domain-containing protein n=1 Tax=Croceicoccus ponticola TaxID=2217664 RepID=A0A437GY93_9SPHN|nr:hypothetical protein [Croceicoccus ponticola]RVQ67638.1 hypothetical protein EKN06_06755 [Croceicoccus ponticola]